ncbi:MAG: AraC family transcriptional regulator [Dysgonamonadaceae bacterium]|jgi:AraC-like DNA-binding protein/mannose-6-phosphate isomerase-like protein (cupin superfamily)|nr:AraC family transcriptional regulator [Dysgonamonadaceae bacterium]
MKITQEKDFSKSMFINSKYQNMWESLSFPANQALKKETSHEATFFFVIEGSIIFSMNDSRNHIVSEQEMFLVPDNCSYNIKVLKPVHLLSCSFSVETLFSEQKMIDELIPLHNDTQDDFVKLPVNKVIKDYLLLLERCIKDGLDSYYFFNLKKHELFILLFAYYTREELARFLFDILSENVQFRGFVINNFLNVKNVQELAGRANYSTSGFIKKFQRYFKESPYRWIQQQKAKLIMNDINEGAKSLQEIATEYKFSSYQHFAHFCKIQFGFPPSELVNKYKIIDSGKIYGKNICQSGKN